MTDILDVKREISSKIEEVSKFEILINKIDDILKEIVYDIEFCIDQNVVIITANESDLLFSNVADIYCKLSRNFTRHSTNIHITNGIAYMFSDHKSHIDIRFEYISNDIGKFTKFLLDQYFYKNS